MLERSLVRSLEGKLVDEDTWTSVSIVSEVQTVSVKRKFRKSSKVDCITHFSWIFRKAHTKSVLLVTLEEDDRSSRGIGPCRKDV